MHKFQTPKINATFLLSYLTLSPYPLPFYVDIISGSPHQVKCAIKNQHDEDFLNPIFYVVSPSLAITLDRLPLVFPQMQSLLHSVTKQGREGGREMVIKMKSTGIG